MIINNHNYQYPECAHKNTTYDEKNGEIVCLDCGLVLEERCFDHEGGVNFYPEDNPTYPRVPVEKYSGGKGTRIRMNNRDDSGRKLDPAAALKARNLRRTEKWFRPPEEKHNMTAAICINEIIRRAYPHFTLSQAIKKEMKKAMKKAVDTNIHWKDWKCLATAVFCLVYRNNLGKNPIKELSELVGFTQKRIFQDYQKLVLSDEIKSFFNAEDRENMKDFVYRYATALELPMNIKKKIFPAFKEIMQSGKFVGKDPSGVLAGLIYGICKESEGISKTQKEVAEIVHVTEVTLRNRHKEICKFFPEIIITMKSS